MEELIVSPYVLAIIFFAIAALYSSVGLGGGSSYTALLAIVGASQLGIPSVSLTLNIAGTTIGSVNFIRGGHARLRLIAPFLLTSIPMAYVGGAVGLPQTLFLWLLMLSLLAVAIRIYAPLPTELTLELSASQKVTVSLLVGAALGFIAGAVGIGGGIYLVPLIILLRLGTTKQAAAVGVIFVWVNSVSGLAARWLHDQLVIGHIAPFLFAVLAGAALGSSLGAGRLAPRAMEKILGVVVVIAVVLLAHKLGLMRVT